MRGTQVQIPLDAHFQNGCKKKIKECTKA